MAGLWACTDVCGSPQQINDIAFDAFVSPLTYTITNETAFPSYASPGNGALVISFSWDTAALEGPLTVTMDDQVFDANGFWSPMDCGNFEVTWAGAYEGTDSRHLFVGAADFVLWGDHIEGFVEWDEDWTDRTTGEEGDYTAFTLLRGVQL